MDKIEKQFLRPVEAAAALSISKSRLYEALEKGEVLSRRIAGQLRVPRRWIDDQVNTSLIDHAAERDA